MKTYILAENSHWAAVLFVKNFKEISEDMQTFLDISEVIFNTFLSIDLTNLPKTFPQMFLKYFKVLSEDISIILFLDISEFILNTFLSTYLINILKSYLKIFLKIYLKIFLNTFLGICKIYKKNCENLYMTSFLKTIQIYLKK